MRCRERGFPLSHPGGRRLGAFILAKCRLLTQSVNNCIADRRCRKHFRSIGCHFRDFSAILVDGTELTAMPLVLLITDQD
jgi:hypothetical protein